MNKYFVFIKDDIAVQAVKSGKMPTSEIFEIEEISKLEFLTLSLPCKRIEGVWTKVDEMPEIEYPSSEVTEESSTPEVDLQQRIAELEKQLNELKTLAEVTS